MESKAKFIVVPKGSFTIQSLGEYLNTFYSTEGEDVHFKCGTVPKDGFYIQHGVITKIKNQFSDWKKRFEFYSQEGGGEIRVYSIPSRKKSAKAKQALDGLAKIVERKKG